MDLICSNARTLDLELAWFDAVAEARINLYFKQKCSYKDIYELPPPSLQGDGSGYACVVRECGLAFDERIVLMLALIPHIRPHLLDIYFLHNKNLDRGFTEFGGWKGKTHSGFLPTGETASFIIAGEDIGKRLDLMRLFEDDHVFTIKGILRIDFRGNHEPYFSGPLTISTEYLKRLTSGQIHKPDYSTNFPAKLITTKLTWDDLVLGHEVFEEIETLKAWFQHSKVILDDWGLGKSIKPGYRSLFYGPPGTGKTLSATLIGASSRVDVYRIDLSMVVSKYIGETEKNLANIFDQAENRDWILFFDEADALFGKRTQTSSSNDRYANQEVSYLLQRIEDFAGVVILASNLKANIDDAFARRFQSLIYFPMPDSDQRLKLWRGNLQTERVAKDVNFEELAEDYELSGGAITNVVRYGAIKALQKNTTVIGKDDLLKGITRELRKEGKTLG